MKFILNNSIITIIISLLLFSSCTIEKRRYSSGYHIDWHINKDHSKKRTKTKVPDSKKKSTVMAQGDSIKIASVDSSKTSIKSTQTPILLATETENTKTKLEKIVADTSLHRNNDLLEIDTLNYVPSIRKSTTAVQCKNSHRSSAWPQNIGIKPFLNKIGHTVGIKVPNTRLKIITSFNSNQSSNVPNNQNPKNKRYVGSIVFSVIGLIAIVVGLIMLSAASGLGWGGFLLALIGFALIIIGIIFQIVAIIRFFSRKEYQ